MAKDEGQTETSQDFEKSLIKLVARHRELHYKRGFSRLMLFLKMGIKNMRGFFERGLLLNRRPKDVKKQQTHSNGAS